MREPARWWWIAAAQERVTLIPEGKDYQQALERAVNVVPSRLCRHCLCTEAVLLPQVWVGLVTLRWRWSQEPMGKDAEFPRAPLTARPPGASESSCSVLDFLWCAGAARSRSHPGQGCWYRPRISVCQISFRVLRGTVQPCSSDPTEQEQNKSSRSCASSQASERHRLCLTEAALHCYLYRFLFPPSGLGQQTCAPNILYLHTRPTASHAAVLSRADLRWQCACVSRSCNLVDLTRSRSLLVSMAMTISVHLTVQRLGWLVDVQTGSELECTYQPRYSDRSA